VILSLYVGYTAAISYHEIDIGAPTDGNTETSSEHSLLKLMAIKQSRLYITGLFLGI